MKKDMVTDGIYYKFILFLIKIASYFPFPKGVKRLFTYETFSYLFIGVLTTIVNYVIFAIVYEIFNVNVLNATLIAWIGAVVFAYFPNKVYVYLHKDFRIAAIIKEFTFFVQSRLLSGFLEWLLMLIMVTIMGMNEYLGKIITSVIVVILNYITGKFLVFRK